MRNAGAAARVKHAEPLRNPPRAAVGIDDANDAAAAFDSGAHAARRQHEDQGRGIAGPRPQGDVPKRVLDRWMGANPRPAQLGRPSGIALGFRLDLAGALEESEQRHGRQQHGDNEQKRRRAVKPALHPQPQIQADATVQPSDREQRELPETGVPGVAEPIVKQSVPINDVNIEKAIGGALGERVLQYKQRDQKAEAEPQRLDPAHPQMPSNVDRPESEREMDGERAVKQRGADLATPDPFMYDAAPFHRLEGNVAEAMIDEMQKHIGKQDEASAQSNPARDRWRAPRERRPAGRKRAASSPLSRVRRVPAKRGHPT